MPHYKCAACKTRLHVSESPAELVGDLCPQCGSLIEPVADLAELVGLRSIESVDRAPDSRRPGSHQRIAARIDEFVTRRAAILERDRLDAERSRDDDDSPGAAEVALPAPRSYL